MIENKEAKPVRAILKKPDEQPEIVKICKDDIPALVNPEGKYTEIQTEEYSSTISMHFTGGKHNFDIEFLTYCGNVLFVKSKNHHSCTNKSLQDMTDEDIKRLYAAMKWGDFNTNDNRP